MGRAFRSLRGRWPRRAACVLLALALAAPCAIYTDVQRECLRIVREGRLAPAAPVAIVFGAGYGSRGPSPILRDRVVTGVGLYRLGKVRKLLMTGDNGRADYNEPAVMRRLAVSMGVAPRDVVLDYAGFRTYDSLYRARAVFGVRRALLVSQEFHLPRALYVARRLGLDADGVAADRGSDRVGLALLGREFLATQSAWIELNVLRRPPRYLGRPEPIFASLSR